MRADNCAGAPQSLLLLLGSCLPVLGAVLLAPILPAMKEHFADSPMAGVLVPISLTIPALMIALFAPLAGVIADRVGRKPLLLTSVALYGFFGLMPIWLDSLPAIVASRAGLGLAEAGIMTCCTTLIGDYFQGARRERLFALQMVCTSLSAAVFMALGGALGHSSWRTPFFLYGAAVVMLPLMSWLLWERPKDGTVSKARDDSEFPWKSLLTLYLFSALAGISLFIVPVQAGFLLKLLGVDSPQQIGLIMGANQLGVLVGALGFRFLHRTPRQHLLLLAFFVAGLGGLLMASTNDAQLVTVAVFINGAGVGLMLPTLVTWVMAQTSASKRGRAAGGFTAALFAGEFISPLVVLSLGGTSDGRLPDALIAIAGIQLLLALACMLLPRMVRGAEVATAPLQSTDG
ncbi:MFS transporter [Pseudomonas sp. CM25]|uniref:MFS transporter n=1 Tax=Pseudomonas sp. CM25 TaxID=2738448 RepID=UPI001556AF78|nr:MFS transporter [Pseudomonas sp. CM25]NQD56559.1 MFS transporter [Pseudomonas sp. CM25]